MEIITCYTHGAAAGNPGAAATGVRIIDEAGTVLYEAGQSIGNSSSNYAAYQAVLVCLEALTKVLGTDTLTTEILVKLDDTLVGQHLSATLPITDPGFVPLFIAIHNLQVVHFPHVRYEGITTVENKEVIDLVAKALDGK
jgi:hypothetical protein